MTGVVELDTRATIETFVRADPALHIYELGDLDPFFWPHTRWFGLRGGQPGEPELAALALLYTGAALPTLLALSRGPSPALARLLESIAERLPARLYAHLGPELLPALGERWHAEPHGRHLKMVLREPARLEGVDVTEVEVLGPANLDELLALYAASYPGNWFDARMLDTKQYVGIRREGELVCVAGVHVYSPRYAVAALGNVTTARSWRGRGLARRAVAGLCLRLRARVETIGLNVHADNAAAIACYRRLGMVEIGDYDEYMLTSPGDPG